MIQSPVLLFTLILLVFLFTAGETDVQDYNETLVHTLGCIPSKADLDLIYLIGIP